MVSKFFFAIIAFSGAAFAQPSESKNRPPQTEPASTPHTQNPWLLKRQLVDRTVLTVEKKVYSLSDIYIILAMWNIAFPSEAVYEFSNWTNISGFILDRNKPFLKQVEKWPLDVQKLLFIAMTATELSRQPLNAPSEAEIAALTATCREKLFLQKIPSEIATAITQRSESATSPLAELVLRAAKFRKNKGALRENARAINWFWHQRTIDVEGAQ